MPSPVVEQVVESSTSTAGTSHVVGLPTATAGQLLLILLDKGSTSATINAHGSLTELLDEASANGLYIAYRWMDGTEPSTYTLTSSASTRSAVLAYRISGAINPGVIAPQIGATASGTSATPDPPVSVAPGSSKDYLFIAFYGADGEEADDDTWSDTPPTSYTPSPPRQKACGVAGTNLGGLIAAAEYALTTGSAQNPGTFAKDVSAGWRAQTIMVHPPANETLTPTTVSLTLATFTPLVTATQGQYPIPAVPTALVLATFVPTVTAESYVAAVLADSPTAYWRLGEASGVAVDDIGTNDGTETGTVTRNVAGAIGGMDDGAVDFDGSTGYFLVPDHADLDLANGPFTLEAWFKRGATGADHCVLSKGPLAPAMFVAASGKLVLKRDGTADILISDSTITDTTTFHHIVMTKNGATSQIYLDGVLTTGTLTDQTCSDGTYSFAIGCYWNGFYNAGANGDIDEVAIYRSVLSAARVAAHYAAGKPSHLLVPTTAALTLATFVPTVTVAAGSGTTVTPTTAALVLTPFAAAIGQGVVPPVVALTLTRFAPVIKLVVIPPAAALTLTPFAPVIKLVVIPPVVALTLATFAPAVGQGVVPPTASLVVSTFVPTVTVPGGLTVTPGVASLTLTPFAPTIALTVVPPVVALSLSTFAPTIALTVIPPTAALTLATFAPRIDLVITPPVRALTLTTFAPGISVGQWVVPSVASLTLASFAPVIGLAIVPPVAALTTTRFAPVVGLAVIPATRALATTTFVPMVSLSANVIATPDMLSLSLSTFVPDVMNWSEALRNILPGVLSVEFFGKRSRYVHPAKVL